MAIKMCVLDEEKECDGIGYVENSDHVGVTKRICSNEIVYSV